MRFFKIIITTIFGFVLFVFLYRITMGYRPFVPLSTIANYFQDFPSLDTWIDELDEINKSLRDLITFNPELESIIPYITDDLIGINYIIDGLNFILNSVFNIAEIIIALFKLLINLVKETSMILDWLLGLFGKFVSPY